MQGLAVFMRMALCILSAMILRHNIDTECDLALADAVRPVALHHKHKLVEMLLVANMQTRKARSLLQATVC